MKIHHYKAIYKDYFVAAFPMQDWATQYQMRTWCRELYSKPGYNAEIGEVRWVDEIEYGEVRIKHQRDLVMFLLRWE